LNSLPPEILLKILSYIDAASLLCIGCVNKWFHKMAKDNALWYKIYTTALGKRKWKPKVINETTAVLSAASIEEKPSGYWRRLYFSKILGNNENKLKHQLKNINPYTGLPSKTEQVLRNLQATWEITVLDKKGQEITFEQSHAYFSESSVTVCWTSTHWPFLNNLTLLKLHGVIRVALAESGTIEPVWRSLMAKHDMKSIWDQRKGIGADKLVTLFHIPPGLIVGIWRGQWSVAFFMASLHFHKLVERSALGSSICPYTVPAELPPFDDVDPEYGLHGYALHISLHNTIKDIMSAQFTQLFCKTDQIRNGFVMLKVIGRNDKTQHTPISGKIDTPWRTDALGGIVENCCLMSLTLLDETQNPFWCVSTPVAMQLSAKESTCFDYVGENYVIYYQDSEGKVQMNFVWLEERGQFFLINLVLFIATEKVNKHFGRQY
ncbi:FBX15 protein, partial [Amia calva]|nr:FBX15 protein [Amia calva]